MSHGVATRRGTGHGRRHVAVSLGTLTAHVRNFTLTPSEQGVFSWPTRALLQVSERREKAGRKLIIEETCESSCDILG